jgi:Spherulation-specific family 4
VGRHYRKAGPTGRPRRDEAMVTMRRAADRRPPPAIGVPAYFYPWPGDPGWADLVDAPAGTLVVATPDNGPGTAPDPNYRAAIEPLAHHGIFVYGYVDSAYASRDIITLTEEVNAWIAWYGVRAIFVDRVAATPANRQHYSELCGLLRRQGLQLALNPGQPRIDPSYLNLADQVLVFEGTLAAYQAQVFPGWMDAMPRERLWHCVYEVADAEQYAEVLHKAARCNAGVVFATDGTMPNPWDRLPPYWSVMRRRHD